MGRLNIADPTFTYDPGDPEGFRAGTLRFGPQVGAKRTGTSVYELPPGQAISPRDRQALTRSGNETDDVVRVLMYSTVSPTAVSVYPDSDKIGVWVDNPDDTLMLPRASAADYYSGEV